MFFSFRSFAFLHLFSFYLSMYLVFLHHLFSIVYLLSVVDMSSAWSSDWCRLPFIISLCVVSELSFFICHIFFVVSRFFGLTTCVDHLFVVYLPLGVLLLCPPSIFFKICVMPSFRHLLTSYCHSDFTLFAFLLFCSSLLAFLHVFYLFIYMYVICCLSSIICPLSSVFWAFVIVYVSSICFSIRISFSFYSCCLWPVPLPVMYRLSSIHFGLFSIIWSEFLIWQLSSVYLLYIFSLPECCLSYRLTLIFYYLSSLLSLL